ncbi:hydroxymethylglutaryl-CoA lyase [Legionella yabuuchiae]|uniref:hydroxymethylglutaryl-CoA lyase n=1 Tax=Legionella yabuuchiae TaxID=376727 RepID=UPI0010566030|nr:hydroxymethylglutaryl-CoA lyase [Legionella yabuuchiae]
MNLPSQVTIIEVGPRDGLQNEPSFVDTQAKIDFINSLTETGLKHIEVTSFVSPKAIPQLADHIEVYQGIKKTKGVSYSVLIPNEQGMQKAVETGVQEIAIFTAASDTFNQRNINCSIAESIERFKPVMELANQHDIPVRAYISCVLGCPYEGKILPEQVMHVAEQLLNLNVNEISFGDTIGVGTPKQTRALLDAVTASMGFNQIAMHFHDTYGQAVANIYAALDYGVNRFDSSVAGLGGCPYAQGATGNVATEDVLYLMHGLGVETGVDIYKVVVAGDKMCNVLKRKNQSKVANALLANPC